MLPDTGKPKPCTCTGCTCLNAPDGAGCSLTAPVKQLLWELGFTRLNAPDGAGCSLTPRRAERQLSCANATPDRQWPNREPSGQRAQIDFRGLFVANTRVATDARISSRSAAFRPLPNEKPTPTPTELLRTSLYYLPCNLVSFLRAHLLADTPSASARSARTAHKDLIYATPRCTQRRNHALLCGRVLREHRRCVREALRQGRPNRTWTPTWQRSRGTGDATPDSCARPEGNSPTALTTHWPAQRGNGPAEPAAPPQALLPLALAERGG